MLSKINAYFLIVTLFFFVSCSIEPSPINYGKDACTFCKMNIVDKQHGAEIVTKKGKVYKFDSIECMLNDLYDNRDENTISLFLVNTYDLPKTLHNATLMTYLQSDAIPSPMRENLSAISNKETALTTQKEKGGKLYSWEALKEKFKTN